MNLYSALKMVPEILSSSLPELTEMLSIYKIYVNYHLLWEN